MELPSYLSGIINTSYKHKQLQTIKQQIKKLLPEGFLPPPMKKKIEKTTRECEFRKTVSNFGQITSVRFDSDSLAFVQPQQHFTLFQRKHSQKKQKREVNRLSQNRDSADEDQGEHMTEWREEMMKHFKPRREVNLEKHAQTAANIPKKNQLQDDIEQKLFKVRTSTPLARTKFKSTLNQKGTQSQKKFILIKPTLVNADQKVGKKLVLMKSKITQSDNYLPVNNWNELAHQRIANFKALLPYLGTQKARVGSKPERKQTLSKYEPAESLKHERNERRTYKKKKERAYEGQISGWDTED